MEVYLLTSGSGREDMGVEGMWDRLNATALKPREGEAEIRSEL